MAFSIKNLFSKVASTASGGSKRSVGVDFGSSAIKVVELEIDGDRPLLKTYGELQLGPYAEAAVGDVVQLQKEKKKEALVDVFRESFVEAREGTFAISLVSSFLTAVPITIGKGESLDARARVEARKYIPVPMTDVTLDWADITQEDVGENLKEVLLVAIQNKVILEYQSLMSSIDMLSQPTEIECFSAIRALDEADEEFGLIIDVGALTTKLYVTNKGMLHRMHRVRTGGQIVTTRLANLLGVTFEEAESLKRTLHQQEVGTDTHKTIASVYERALSEFKRVIGQYESRTGADFSRIVLTGSSARLPSLAELIQSELGYPVEVADPFQHVAYPAFMADTMREIGPNFSVAIGAALRKLQ